MSFGYPSRGARVAAFGLAVLLAASAPSAWAENYMQKWPAADGSPPSLRSAGSSDTNIGIELLPAGTGMVGIATTSPQSLLHVYNGEVQVGSSGASCAAGNNGAIRFSGTTLYYCSGTTWSTVGSAAAAGSDTQVQYNNSGVFGASANYTWNYSTNALTITGSQTTTNAAGGGTAITGTANTGAGGSAFMGRPAARPITPSASMAMPAARAARP